MGVQRITFDEWIEKFRPIKNHLVQNAPYDEMFFEIFGSELELIETFKKTNPKNVWTILSGLEQGDTIVSGYHFVNRYGYFITEVPCEEELNIEILIEGSDEYGITKEQHKVFIKYAENKFGKDGSEPDEEIIELIKGVKNNTTDFEILFVQVRQTTDFNSHFETEWAEFLAKEKNNQNNFSEK